MLAGGHCFTDGSTIYLRYQRPLELFAKVMIVLHLSDSFLWVLLLSDRYPIPSTYTLHLLGCTSTRWRPRLLTLWEKLVRKYPGFDLEREFFAYAQETQDQKDPQLAIKVFEEIQKYFPASSNRDKAAFMIGFVYSEQLKDYPKAKEAFEKFIKEYPQSDLKDDAEFMLKNLGKEPELEKSK